ncbi:MAG: hypothetical protein IK997_07125 [Bacilli bacterium]|nr:hypothetical protein [Bacilli bacterium]
MENNNEVNNIQQQPEKQKRKGTGVIIVILLIVILGLCGYIAYDKFLNNTKDDTTEEKETKNNEKKETTKKEENLEVTNKEVTDLFDSITNANTRYCGVSELFTDKKITVNDIDNDLASDIALYNLRTSGVSFKEGSTITKKQLDDTITKLFGKNYKYTHGNIRNCPSFTYDESKEIYTVGMSACGGTCGPRDYVKIVKATKTDSKIELNIRVLFRGDEEFKNAGGYSYPKYYKDSKKTIEVDLTRDYENIPLETSENYQKGSLYKMIFTNEDGNYVFTSSELVNE